MTKPEPPSDDQKPNGRDDLLAEVERVANETPLGLGRLRFGGWRVRWLVVLGSALLILWFLYAWDAVHGLRLLGSAGLVLGAFLGVATVIFVDLIDAQRRQERNIRRAQEVLWGLRHGHEQSQTDE